MGYESRVYVGERFTFGEGQNAFFVEWSVFNLCKMGGDKDGHHFKTCFKTDTDFDLYENDERIVNDCYDEHVRYCHIEDILAWFDNCNEDMQYYMRAQAFAAYLKAIQSDMRKVGKTEIICIHYGY